MELNQLKFEDGPLISVVVPVYNAERQIEKCLDSILSQTFNSFELILVDDGSTDKCGDICDCYALKDSRIKVFHKENRGVSAARNTGIDNAQGEWLCFVDADDWIEENYLDVLYRVTPRTDMPFQGFIIQANNTQTTKKLIYSNDAIEMAEINNILNSPCYKLYRRSIIIQENIRFLVGCNYGEDHIFTLEYLCTIKNKPIYTPGAGYVYVRETNNSLSRGAIPYQYVVFYMDRIRPLLVSVMDRTSLSEREKAVIVNKRMVDQAMLAYKIFFRKSFTPLADYKNMREGIFKNIISYKGTPVKYKLFLGMAKKMELHLSYVVSSILIKILSSY